MLFISDAKTIVEKFKEFKTRILFGAKKDGTKADDLHLSENMAIDSKLFMGEKKKFLK